MKTIETRLEALEKAYSQRNEPTVTIRAGSKVYTVDFATAYDLALGIRSDVDIELSGDVVFEQVGGGQLLNALFNATDTAVRKGGEMF